MLQWEPTRPMEGPWSSGRCPTPGHDDEHPSFSINHDTGGWICHSCPIDPQKGGILDLLEKCGQGTRAQMQAILWPKNREEPKPAADLPTEELLRRWQAAVGDSELVADYLSKHAISYSTVQEYGLGWDGTALTLPVLNRAGELVNVKKRNLKKAGSRWIGIRGRSGVMPYPAWRLPTEGCDVIVEGESDCLALRTLGVDAITTTGGSSSLNMENLGTTVRSDGQPVYICTDNDKAGRTARARIKAEAAKLGIPVGNIFVPGGYNDISSWLAATPANNRVSEWQRAVETAAVGGDQLPVTTLHEVDGQLVSFERGDTVVTVAPFTGKCVETGLYRSPDGERVRCFVFELTHMDGSELTIRHIEGTKFLPNLMAARNAGPKWSLPTRWVEDVRHHLCMRSHDVEQIDQGWVFGYDEDFDTFWSKSAIISESRIAENTEIRMYAPGKFADRFDLPVPGDSASLAGGRLIVDKLARAHYTKIMLPLIATGLAAPIRRRLFPDEPRWPTFVRGRTGCGKTTRCRPIQSMFGSFPSQDHLVTFSATSKALEVLMTQIGDSVILLDDLKRDRMSYTAWRDNQRMIQDMPQGQGRMRASRTGELIALPEAHCLALITCEAMGIDDEALIARSLVVDYPEVDYQFFSGPEQDNWLDVMDNLEVLPHAMATWIHHTMREMDQRKFSRLRTHCSRQIDEVLTKIPGWSTLPNSNRVSNRLGVLSAVWLWFCNAAVELEWATTSKAQQLESDWLDACEWVARSTFHQLREVGGNLTAMDVLAGLLSSGKAVLRGRHGWLPATAIANATQVGWVEYRDPARPGKGKWQKMETIEGHKIGDGQRVSGELGVDRRLFLNQGCALACNVSWREFSESMIASGEGRVGNKDGAKGIWVKAGIAKQLIAQATIADAEARNLMPPEAPI